MNTPFSAYSGDGNYIFISYAHKDAANVYPAIEALHAKGFRIWYDEGIEAGQDWANAIGTSLEKASAVLLFLSKNSIASDNVRREVTFAEAHDIPVVSVSIGDVKLPDDLAKKLTVRQITNMANYATYGTLADALSPALTQYGTKGEETLPYEDRKITLAEKKKKQKMLATVLAVLVILGVIAGILFGVFFKEVPDVVGLDTEIAEATLNSAGFRSTVSLNYSEEYPYGVIISQSASGKNLIFIPVVITESLGSREDLTDVPDTVGDHVSDGVSKMLTAGLSKFSLAEDNETNKDAEKNHIASQSIPAGLRVSKANAVSLGVATADGTVTFERQIGTKKIEYKVFVGVPVLVTIDDVTDEVTFEFEDGTVTVDKDGNATVEPDGGNADEIAKRVGVGGDIGSDGPDDTGTGEPDDGGETDTGNETQNGTGNGGTAGGDTNQGNTQGDTNTGTGNGNTQTGNNEQTGNGNTQTGNDTQTGEGNEGSGGTGDATGEGGTGNTETQITNINVANYEELAAALANLPPSVKSLTVLGGTPDASEEERQSIEATITIPAGVTVTIPEGIELGGVGNVIDNYGTLIFRGTYESGMTSVNNYGTLRVYGTYVGGMGETHNRGTFVVEPGGLLILERGQQMILESGSLTNNGTVYIGVGGNVQWKGGSLTNNGTINVADNELYRTVDIDYSAYNGAGDLNMLSDEDYNALIDAMSAQNEYELIPEKIE